MIRRAVVAGQFYPGDKTSLLKMLETFFEQVGTVQKLDMKAAIVPHAGYIYSGKTAGSLYKLVSKDIETAIILGPNHTGLGSEYSIMQRGSWATPLGEVKIDEEVTEQLSKDAEMLEDDFEAHRREHSIEVHVPFLQYINPKIKIVPIVLAGHNLEKLKIIAETIALVVKEKAKKILVIASSDMTHYEEAEEAREKDKHAIETIVALDDEKFIQTIKKYSVSMCGVLPCYVSMHFAKKMGSMSGKLIEYSNSGDVSGDYSSVVGYAAIALV